MFMVGGGILAHGIPGAEVVVQAAVHVVAAMPGVGGVLTVLLPSLLDVLLGLVAGVLSLLVAVLGGKLSKFIKQLS